MPPAPSRADDGNAFSAKADATFAALPTTISGMNALGAYLDGVGAAVDADAAAASASAMTAELARDAAVGAANFQGPWAIGTTYLVGQSVAYDGSVYIALRTTVGDQPDISPLDWLPLAAGGGSLLGAYVPVNTNYVVPDGHLEVPSTLLLDPAMYPDLAAVTPGVTGAVIQSTLQSANPEASGQFGYSVAIAGDYAIVGAYLEDGAGVSNSGRAYIYVRSGTTWTLQATLRSPDTESSGLFGYSVAIAGDYAIVGALNENGAGVTDSGRAYIYVRSGTTWTLQATLQSANPEATGQFGYSVAIAGDYAIVGARFEDAAGLGNSGRAYIYLRSGTSWTLQATLQSANPESSGLFGESVAIAGDYAIVGAIQEDAAGQTDSGRAYIYLRSGTSWTLQATLQSANPESSGLFGYSVAIAGDYAIVGARLEDAAGLSASGRAYIYVRSGTSWTLQATLQSANPESSGQFGYSVAIAGDYAIVGAIQEDAAGLSASGRAYIYVRSGTSWTLQATLQSANPESSGLFGYSVAISGDYAIVGAIQEDAAALSDSGRAYTVLAFQNQIVLNPLGIANTKTIVRVE
jgi:hypothetical protein